MRRRFRGPKIIAIIFFALLALTLVSGAVMLLWNNILVQVMHVSIITFWQAMGILVLSKLLFGGFRGGHWGRNRWKEKMNERWEKMTPEDREKFKEEWKNRCGHRFGRRFEEERKTEQQQ
jgi:hypothetical protein